LWDLTTGEELHVLRTPGSAAYLNALSFSPDGRLLASAHGVWDLETLSAIQTWTDLVMHVAFSPDGAMLAIGAELEPTRLFDTTTWVEIRTFESLKHVAPTSDDSFGFEFSLDGVWLADGTLNEGLARIWDVETGTLTQSLTVSPAGTDVHDVAFSSDGRFLAAGGQGWSVVLFRMEDGTIERTLPTGEGTMSLDFSPDGRLLAISCEGAVSLWDVETGRRLRTLSHAGTVLPVTFSPDGRFLACGVRGGHVAVWGLLD
jgi:WD40 repeat protein